MPEPLDLDALGREHDRRCGCPTLNGMECREARLIAELRATRAELGAVKLAAVEMHASFNEAIARAERAEADVAAYRKQLKFQVEEKKRAEAAIADHDECAWSRRAWDALDALVDAKAAIARVEAEAADLEVKWLDTENKLVDEINTMRDLAEATIDRAERAEADLDKALGTHDSYRCAHLARAERAEAELAEERQVAEGYASDVTHYQATIARVEALCDGKTNHAQLLVGNVRAALRGPDA